MSLSLKSLKIEVCKEKKGDLSIHKPDQWSIIDNGKPIASRYVLLYNTSYCKGSVLVKNETEVEPPKAECMILKVYEEDCIIMVSRQFFWRKESFKYSLYKASPKLMEHFNFMSF